MNRSDQMSGNKAENLGPTEGYLAIQMFKAHSAYFHSKFSTPSFIICVSTTEILPRKFWKCVDKRFSTSSSYRLDDWVNARDTTNNNKTSFLGYFPLQLRKNHVNLGVRVSSVELTDEKRFGTDTVWGYCSALCANKSARKANGNSAF